MEKDVRKRIDELKEKNGFKTDGDVISQIFHFKKSRGQTGKLKEFEYVEKNKGSFSKCFNGKRNFKLEDYLALEYVLNTSMAYIIEGKGEASSDFIPHGIRYVAFTDTIGNYEELMNEGILNGSDEYDKTLLDYMIEYKSKNGFIYFAEHNQLPFGATGGNNSDFNCLHCYHSDRITLLKILCELLPIELLKKYFDGFFDYFNNSLQIDEQTNTSFADEVIAVAIKRADLRKEACISKQINLDSYNRVRRYDGKSLGEGLFINYTLIAMIKYALKFDVDEEIKNELIESALRINEKSFKSLSTFVEDELKIDKQGYITDKYGHIYFGNIVIPPETNTIISDKTRELLSRLDRQVHDYHEFISNNSKISIFRNEIIADKKDNQEYYDFFNTMNEENVMVIPLFKGKSSKDKDLFEVSNAEKSRISNWTDEDIKEILVALRKIDDVSMSKLNGNTYYLRNLSIYMHDGKVNYIMPKDVLISNRYSNLIDFINSDVLWSLYETRKKERVNKFIKALKIYGINKNELENFIQLFIEFSEEQAQSIDKSSDSGKETALKVLENKSLVEIFKNDIIEEF